MSQLPPLSELAADFRRDGFLRIESLTTADDLATIRGLIDPLFARGGDAVQDLGDVEGDGGAPRIPEVDRPSVHVRALRRTLAWARCRDIAGALLGAPVGWVFDHAIYKPPHNRGATRWHQDDAYAARPVPLRTVHFWIPLQNATVENGCMWYLKGSHQRGLVPHETMRSATGGRVLVASPPDADSAVPCPVPAGGAAVHGPLTLHYSGPNEAGETRRAWIVHFGAYGRLGVLHPLNLAAKLRARFTS